MSSISALGTARNFDTYTIDDDELIYEFAAIGHRDGLIAQNVPTSSLDGTRRKHLACKNCRIKKLKCLRDKGACSACASRRVKCDYSTSTSKPNKAESTTTRSDAQQLQVDSGETPEQLLSDRSSESSILTPILTPCPMDADSKLMKSPLSGVTDGNHYNADFLRWNPSPLHEIDEIFESQLHTLMNDVAENTSLEPQNIAEDGDATNDFTSSDFPFGPDLMFAGVDIAYNNRGVLEAPQPLSESPASPIIDQRLKDYLQEQPSGFVDTPITTTCPCLKGTVTILERLEVFGSYNYQALIVTVDGVLSLSKTAIASCNSMLDCPSCLHLSSSVMLLILICRNLVAQFERLLMTSTSVAETEQIPTPRVLDQDTHSQVCIESNLSLGEYSIDTSEELKGVLHALVVIQGKSLRNLLERIRSVTSGKSWTAHEAILERIETQHFGTMRSLQQVNSG
ncbi:hypothetical protein K449DRAFT_445502 [Hypoxylon sp. EC38]|nr:hypothetical protein K449DRAFT_445502 [Hypoxylon sp. EC38]